MRGPGPGADDGGVHPGPDARSGRPDPAVAAVRVALRPALRDLPPGALVLVACSGGADSLALAAGTAFVARAAGLRAGAVVVDHGWHPDSATVAAAAAAACRGLGLDPVEVVAVTPEGPGGPEAAARDARYGALDDVADRHGAAAVLLGHTRDDQAETVLLGLARGSGARSLTGMPATRGRLRRPLLELSRAQLRQACLAQGLQPWEDPANAEPRYARVRVRAAMAGLEAALGPGLVAALARTGDLLREDADALDAAARDLLRAARLPSVEASMDASGGPSPDAGPERPDALVLDAEVLAAAPDAVRRRALRAAAIAAGSPAGSLGRRHVLAMDALVVRWSGQGKADLPGRIAVRRACGRLQVGRAGPPSEPAETPPEA